MLILTISGHVTATSKRLIVSNAGNNTLSIIDTAKNEVINTLRVGVWPAGIVVDSDNNRAYVANHEGVSVSIIDTTKNEVVGTIKLSPATDSTYSGSPWGIAIY